MRLRLRFYDDVYETVAVTPVAPGVVRLDAAPVLAPEPTSAGDVVEFEALPDGTHRVVRVVERGPTGR